MRAETPTQLVRARQRSPANDDPVPVAADVERDDPSAERAHGTDDGRHLVDGVRDDESTEAEPLPNKMVALAGQPLRLSDGARVADEEILDDKVEPPSFPSQVRE